MPFERYLRYDDQTNNQTGNHLYYYQDPRHPCYDDADCHFGSQQSYWPETHYDFYRDPHAVQFQIPQFMLNGPPVLAPGGGAEVLPAGLLDTSDSFASSWFANNGFAPFHSSLISRQIASGSTPSDNTNTPPYPTCHPNGSQRLLSNFAHHFTPSVDSRQQLIPEPSQLEPTANYVHDFASPPSAGSSRPASYALTPDHIPSFPVTASSTIGLPVYSASGFDVLSILSRVVNRPNPAIQLGPVDLSCSFVIVDVRRYDCPIVYASPTFCHLTGYSEQEVLGRNCRFLQSPTGNVAKGELRRFASAEAVSYMRKHLSSSKECQTTLINYRKGGQAFINLVTVIPLRGGVHNTPEEADEVSYHIGFQVDLTEQPTRILDKLRDGSYHSPNDNVWGTGTVTNGGLLGLSQTLGQLAQAQNMTNIGPKGGRHGQMMSIAVSKDLRNLIADTTYTDVVAITTATNMSGSTSASSASGDKGSKTTTPLTMLVSPSSCSTSMNRSSASCNTMGGSVPVSLSPSLSLLLLEFLPDFLLVLSLKGAFLYVAPSVRLVLGYEPQELVGKGISDVCHPADLVPLMRELKEGSVSGLGIPGTIDFGSSTGPGPNLVPKSVDLLFRALPKGSTFSPPGETSSEQGDSQSTSASPSQSSSGTLCSNDLSDIKAVPYVWLECRGRLHVEPGKGRKAIILSGRTRSMPSVRWSTIDRVDGLGGTRCQEGGSRGSRSCETSLGDPGGPTFNPLEFWALLSSQGTFLVASASVRDVLGWGTSEMIGRRIGGMVRDDQGDVTERVEAELAKLDTLEARNMVDPPPLVVTTSLVHRELHLVPVRLAFYRTPQSDKRSSSSHGVASAPLVHPLDNPLCPIVCQATVLSNAEYRSKTNSEGVLPPHPGHVANQTQIPAGLDDDTSRSLFEELECFRGSSWQYELQQLKFANQRLHEEVQALERRCAEGDGVGSGSGSRATGHGAGSGCTRTTIPVPQPHYGSSMHSSRPSNGLHELDPPCSGWSSLTGANGQGQNPLKRSWQSENGPTT